MTEEADKHTINVFYRQISITAAQLRCRETVDTAANCSCSLWNESGSTKTEHGSLYYFKMTNKVPRYTMEERRQLIESGCSVGCGVKVLMFHGLLVGPLIKGKRGGKVSKISHVHQHQHWLHSKWTMVILRHNTAQPSHSYFKPSLTRTTHWGFCFWATSSVQRACTAWMRRRASGSWFSWPMTDFCYQWHRVWAHKPKQKSQQLQ